MINTCVILVQKYLISNGAESTFNLGPDRLGPERPGPNRLGAERPETLSFILNRFTYCGFIHVSMEI